MTPDFSPAMLKGFLRARVKMTAYLAAYPAPPLSGVDLAKAESAARAAIRKQAGITALVFGAAWDGRAIDLPARQKLWLALGVNPAAHGIRLVDGDRQQEVRDAA